MLIPSKVVERIKAGEISLIFRRWKKAGVKSGGTQMTRVGIVGIDAIDIINESDISDMDATAAGFESRQELIEQLYDRDDCELYRIKVHWVGEDPRKQLRESADLSSDQLNQIIEDLDQLDARSKRGNWTQQYLQMIHDQPNTHAQILAESIGLDIPTFKPWIRKLKALGLTESLRPGYRLSRRGEKVLKALQSRRPR